jgi:poly-beta-1,6-N-acetyl-D-glucosamine synthase
MRLAVVVSFLDEEACLPDLLDSLAAQERAPDELLLVDDGSTDGSAERAEEFCDAHGWASLLQRPRRPPERDRLGSASELRSFQWAVERLDERWDILGKIDADMVLTPATLAAVVEGFERDPRLGMSGPFIAEPGVDGRPQRKPCGPGHVEGSTKFYRRACFEQISPIPAILGWDTIDEARARMHGWITVSFAAPDGDPLHSRPMGARDGWLRAFRRWGLCGYAYGAHPLHVLAYGGRLMADEPYVAGGLNYLAGYAWAAVRRVPRAEPELRREVRREQLGRVLRRVRRLRHGGV